MNHESESSSERLRKLLLRANDGEATARQELVDAAAERLRLLAQRMLRRYPRLQRWEETDDVMQEATWKLYRSLEAVHPGTVREFFGLAATQVRRTLIDLVRHHFGPEGVRHIMKPMWRSAKERKRFATRKVGRKRWKSGAIFTNWLKACPARSKRRLRSFGTAG